MTLDVVKTILPGLFSFGLGVIFAHFLARFLSARRMWKKRAGKRTLSGEDAPIFNALHKEREVGVPKMGGAVVWASVLSTAALFWLIPFYLPADIFSKLDFVSRGQTWLPLAALIVGALVGLLDDFLEVKGTGGHIAGGLSLMKRLTVVACVALLAGLWFYYKLDVESIALPFV